MVECNRLVLKQKEAALQILTELCNDHPEYVYGQYLRGEEYLQRGDVKTAFESFRSALRSDDGDYRVWLGLGDCYVFQKDYKTAVAHYMNAITLFPHCTNAYSRLVQAWIQLGDKGTAQRLLSKGLSIDGEHPSVSEIVCSKF